MDFHFFKQGICLFKQRKNNKANLKYACPMPKRENGTNINNEVIQFTIIAQTFLHVLLTEIRGKPIPF